MLHLQFRVHEGDLLHIIDAAKQLFDDSPILQFKLAFEAIELNVSIPKVLSVAFLVFN
jgi:hypothetical protein